MLIVKDAMVVIHLAKTSLLEESCKFFGRVLIPKAVYREILRGGQQHMDDIQKLKTLIMRKNISVKNVKSISLIKKANNFNIYYGEAEAVALYWQEKADLLATDDDNVRRKSEILEISTIGTPSIIIKLFHKKKIYKDKYLSSIKKLKEIGWFSSTVFDKMLLEVENG